MRTNAVLQQSIFPHFDFTAILHQNENTNVKALFSLFAMTFLVFGALTEKSFAQAELAAWGNMSGIRIDGQLMKVPTSICLIGPSMAEVMRSEKEHQRPTYRRVGNRQIVTTELSKFLFTGDSERYGKRKSGDRRQDDGG